MREAITIANATSGAQTISFQSGVVVALTSALPTVTGALTIAGGTINASGAGGADCLTIGAGSTNIDGLSMTGCGGKPISVTAGNDVHISNTTLSQSGRPLEIGTAVGTGVIIGPGNVISGTADHCIALYNSGTLVRDNQLVDCATDGVFLSSRCDATSIIGNLIVRAGTGIGMGAQTNGTVMWFNTVVGSVLSGINIGQATGNDLRNNVSAYNGAWGIVAADSKFTQQDYNGLFSNGSGACTLCTPGIHSVLLDPMFVNMAGGDYTLQSGSPMINAGTPIGSDRNGAGAGDFNGSAPDLGYWESP